MKNDVFDFVEAFVYVVMGCVAVTFAISVTDAFTLEQALDLAPMVLISSIGVFLLWKALNILWGDND